MTARSAMYRGRMNFAKITNHSRREEMKTRTIVGLAVAVFVAFMFASPLALSKPEFAKKEGKPCTNCHVKAGQPELNDVGKCYKENKFSLEKCGEKK